MIVFHHHKKRNFLAGIFLSVALIVSLTGCGQGSFGDSNADGSFSASGAKQTIRVLSGSENKELEHILEKCSKETKVNIEITYQGSVDIMRTLQSGAEEYDAVWPASSLWISLGDSGHLTKHSASVSTTPVVFGIRQSLAEELGFTKGDVSVKDILNAIEDQKMSFCMTSATQSNSGASAYIGFLYALLDKKEALSEADLDNTQLKKQIKNLFSGIDRSSGSSDWLKDMFLKGNYDAMVNYECLIISANKQLEAEGKEPLYVVYPYDGLSIADSPFAYVNHGDDKKEEAFLKVQEYLLSETAQQEIQETGRRTDFSDPDKIDKHVFQSKWGIDTEKILSPISMPSAEVLLKALNLYQTELKKPSLNVYCLDFSGSMAGEGNEQLVEAMSQILLQENAEKNLLQATEGEINIVITFSDRILHTYVVEDSSKENLENLYTEIANEICTGGTDIYLAAEQALSFISETYDLSQYTPAIILMTDGMSNGFMTYDDFAAAYEETAQDVPVFSIRFGDAEEKQLDELARLTNAKDFDGRENLVETFRSVKGYN